MKRTILTESDINEIIRLYTTKEISSIHVLGEKFKISHQNIRKILQSNGIVINSVGGQLKYGREVVIDRYLDKNRKDGKMTIAICKKTNKKFRDYANIAGSLTNHIKNLYPDVIIPSSYKRRKIFESTGKYWHEEYFNLIDQEKQLTKKCKYCDWETIDIENKTGSYVNHLIKSHNKTIEQYLLEFPDEIIYHNTFIKQQQRDDILSKKDNYLICSICGEKMKHINNSHLKTHNTTPEEYKLQYGINSLMSNSLTLSTTKRLNQYNQDLIHFSPVSKDEVDIKNLITSFGFTVIERDRKILNGMEIDLMVSDLNLGIEYNGNKFHTEYYGGKYPNYHLDKLKISNSKGFGLIQIFEDEWILKKDIVINKIKHILGVSSGKKIGARKCKIKEILTNEKNNFLEQYHIQGADTASIKLGAFYENELIAVMTFKNITIKDFELTRFATNYNYIIPGIASKLLKYFIRHYQPKKIINFADRRWTIKKDDNLYTKLNFKLIEVTRPDYKYYNTKIHRYKRYHKFQFRRKNLIKKYDINPNLTEKEMMKELGYDRIWDCGLFKYELIIS
jgi:hypothetical protein